jgi:hypothetical protein
VVVALRHLAFQLEELTRLGHLQENPADAAFRELLDERIVRRSGRCLHHLGSYAGDATARKATATIAHAARRPRTRR